MAADALPRRQLREPSEADYDEICATVMATARGRWFLDEYARRHRNADTEAALAALRRLEENLRNSGSSWRHDRLRDELRAVVAIIREGRAELEAPAATPDMAQKVLALLDLLDERVDALIEPPRGDPAPALRNPESPRPYLTVVPPPAEPPPQTPEPTAKEGLLPEVAFSPQPATPAAALPAGPQHKLAAAREMFPAEIFAPAPVAPPVAAAAEPPKPAIVEAKPDVIRDIMALTEAERIALFT